MDGVDNTDTTARIVTDSDHAHPKQEPADSPASASPTSSDMAAAVAAQPLVPGANAVQPGTGVNKRYRPAPAKTFQCRGFGDCRMVFSRSEHLARHIRKHTGERPFTCHCGKQFSRLDNLRQHAQTVHADKQEENERMMKDLASLHASMSASNRTGSSRGKRAQAAAAAASSAHQSDGLVKSEVQSIPMHPRPGTSTGYEGTGPDHPSILYHNAASWQVPSSSVGGGGVDRTNIRSSSHSFRGPGQSFRAPTSTASSSAFGSHRQQQQQQQYQQPLAHSFLPLSTGPSFSFGLPDLPAGDARPGSSTSRPPTSGGGPNDGAPRSLPPLAAVVSSAFASQPPPASLSQSTTRPLVQAQLQQRITTQSALYTMEALDWSVLAQNYPYQALDAAQQHQVAAAWQQQQQQQQQQTQQQPQHHHPLPASPAASESATIHHFRSTLQPSPTHSHHSEPILPHHRQPQATTLANGLSQDHTMMMARVSAESLLAAAASTSTSTSRNPDLSLDGSPSWNSAMTQMQAQELEQFYGQYQQQVPPTHQVSDQQQQQQQQQSLPAQTPHPGSSHSLPPSRSTIPAHHYSQELHRQQQAQLMAARERQRQRENEEQARRNSEEAEYLHMQQQQQLAASYRQQQQQQQQQLQAQAQAQQRQYFQLQDPPRPLHHYPPAAHHQQLHPAAHDHLPSPQLFSQQHDHHHQQQHYFDGLPDGLGSLSPASVMKFEDGPLHTPPLPLE
ncbi:hypothetical protein GLOTRDRAFT_123536 [Gloeophyllum trabeum ATCC 11539]|uniref:C2H2-type domain-containing protein n=1 Tax=Gloeophyllum trabeum (strain ATCC 11539 / FP-39264 / Madison 617) TaxID=670483 RepID=S7R8T2_GLOTA|nr:uncharacterized protein GLOTRDRAFT_123536 [Gloeophyllum trabeum ATCC 11539]EPQ50730.1 hypothetical protein GLOTRDRAFT_123536 [Gloeophyllum trabeum ATCC 11539]